MSVSRETPYIIRTELVRWINGDPYVIEDEWNGRVVVLIPQWSEPQPGHSFSVVDCISGATGILHYNDVAEYYSEKEAILAMSVDQYKNHVRCRGILRKLSHDADEAEKQEKVRRPLTQEDINALSSYDDDDNWVRPRRSGIPGLIIRMCDRVSSWMYQRFPQ